MQQEPEFPSLGLPPPMLPSRPAPRKKADAARTEEDAGWQQATSGNQDFVEVLELRRAMFSTVLWKRSSIILLNVFICFNGAVEESFQKADKT